MNILYVIQDVFHRWLFHFRHAQKTTRVQVPTNVATTTAPWRRSASLLCPRTCVRTVCDATCARTGCDATCVRTGCDRTCVRTGCVQERYPYCDYGYS